MMFDIFQMKIRSHHCMFQMPKEGDDHDKLVNLALPTCSNQLLSNQEMMPPLKCQLVTAMKI